MPFTYPWRDYQSGDLFYGLAGSPTIGRNIVINFLATQGKIKKGDVVTIDQYDILSDARAKSLNANPLKHDPDFIKSLEANAKYKQVVDTDLTDDVIWMADPVSAVAHAKRKCKGGLDYITRHTTYHIHFCLQNLDLVGVASKSYDGSKGGMADNPQGQKDGLNWSLKARSITGAELRWVYRNRRDPNVRNKIQFWEGSSTPNQCPPPWEDAFAAADVKKAWAAYVPTKEFP